MPALSRGQLLEPCWQGMRFNLRPALVLQAFALLIVCGYFWSAPIKAALDVVGGLSKTLLPSSSHTDSRRHAVKSFRAATPATSATNPSTTRAGSTKSIRSWPRP